MGVYDANTSLPVETSATINIAYVGFAYANPLPTTFPTPTIVPSPKNNYFLVVE